MRFGKVGLFAITVSIVGLIAISHVSNAQEANEAQPGWDTIRVAEDGVGLSYQVWWEWSPLIVPLPDGGAWAFFSAIAAPPSSATPAAAGTQRLYASRFDPEQHIWLPATAMPGGDIQFAPTAAVSTDGVLHLAYTDRESDNTDSFGVVVYVRSDGDGGWTTPTAIAPDENAGHQLAPSAALDQTGQLHVAWQDQRAVDQAARGDVSNADVFASSLTGDTWSSPVQLNERPSPATYASRPQLAADDERVVATWLVYDQADIRSALRIEWAERPLRDDGEWTTAEPVLDRAGDDTFTGGRLVDMAANPTGGVGLVYANETVTQATPQPAVSYSLYLRHLATGEDTWSDEISLGSGDRGGFPSLAFAPDGTGYVAYNLGSGDAVNVAAIAVSSGSAGPEVNLTAGEDGAQGVPVIAVDPEGGVWILYLNERSSGDVNQIRILRGATIPAG